MPIVDLKKMLFLWKCVIHSGFTTDSSYQTIKILSQMAETCWYYSQERKTLPSFFLGIYIKNG